MTGLRAIGRAGDRGIGDKRPAGLGSKRVFIIGHTGVSHCALLLEMGRRIEPAEATSELSAEELADQFATLAVKVVLEENAEIPVLSVLANRKVRPEPY